MRKNRNAFFPDNQLEGPMVANGSFQSSAYYNANMQMPNYFMPQNNIDLNSDISERLAKLERNYNRLEHRISKLESLSTVSTDDYESTTNNMYII